MLTTIDRILGEQLILEQPKEGYRVAIDPVFLAGSVDPKPLGSILDVGCGVGAASLCLAHRLSTLRIHGFDLQSDLIRLASQNAMRNNLRDTADFMVGSLQKPPPRLIPSSYDYVISNPPFYEKARSVGSYVSQKDLSHRESEVTLKTWLQFCVRMLRLKGQLTLIHRPERLEEILSVLTPLCGAIKIYPLWPKKNKEAKRLLIQAEKGSAAPLKLMAGMVLHQEDGSYTTEADLILRGRAILSL